MATAKKTAKPQVETEAGNDLTAPKKTFARKKAVTVPTLQIADEQTVFVKIISKIEKKEKVDEKTQEVGSIEVGRVIDLQQDDPVEQSLVFGTVLQKELETNYPEDSYVGKSFEITKHKVEGRRYKTYELYEIEAE